MGGHDNAPGMPPSVGAPPFDLEASLGYLVGVVSRRMTRDLNQQLQHLGVTAPQFVVLAVLWQYDGLAQNVMADLIGSDRPTLTAMLKLMTAQGLVRRDRNAADNRYQRVYLTPEGRRLRRKPPALAARVNEAAAADLSPEDLATLMSLLTGSAPLSAPPVPRLAPAPAPAAVQSGSRPRGPQTARRVRPGSVSARSRTAVPTA